MKKFFYLALVLCMGFAMTSCDDDDELEGLVTLVVQGEHEMTADQLTVMEGEEYVLAPKLEGADSKTTFEWELDGEVISRDSVLRYTFEEAGEYLIFLSATNSHKSSIHNAYHVTVKPWMLDFEGDYWTKLIDSPQYNGQLLYGEGKDTYDWTDPITGLQGGLTRAWGGTYGFSEGGIAISNYICDSLQTHATYIYQLEVPVSNGSNNFAVVYCDASLHFDKGVSRVIRSMDICPTTYLLGVETYGDGYAKALTEAGDNMVLTITADNGKTLDVDFARDGNILKGWKHIDLSALGEVNSLSFTMDGSDKSDWGVKHPKYFAFDNVQVKMK